MAACLAACLTISPAWSDSLEQSRDVLRKSGCSSYVQYLRKQAAGGDPWSLAQIPSLDVLAHPCGDPDRSGASLARILALAAQGNALAKTRAGQAYIQGLGVSRDVARGMALLREASEQGEASATYNLGLAQLYGWVGEKDESAARALFSRLEANQHVLGDTGMGLIALHGAKPDVAAGLAWLEKAAGRGDPVAQRVLGSFHEQGQSGHQDLPRAVRYYRNAAALMDWPAQVALGRLTLRGQGTKADPQAAARLFEAAGRLGGATAAGQIGRIYFDATPPDYGAAAPWLAQAARQGDRESAKRLGWLRETGQGVARSEEEALRLYRQASSGGDSWSAFRLYQMLYDPQQPPSGQAAAMAQLEQAAALGHAKAMLILAQAYDQGRGHPRDKAQAARWWQAAADAGEAVGMYNLGVAYWRGEGVPQSHQTAFAWFGKASVAGHPDALGAYKAAYLKVYPERSSVHLFSLAEAGSRDAQDELANAASTREERLKWTRRAAEGGHARAQHRLAGFYLNGIGVERDVEAARAWLLRSAEGGFWGGYAGLADIAAGKLGGLPQDPEAAKRWYRAGIDQIRDESGKRILQTELDKFLDAERRARWAEEAEKARKLRQAQNLPPEASDIHALMMAAWDRHLDRGRLQSDGTFSKGVPLLGLEVSRTEMWVEDVSCAKDQDNHKCGGYKCGFATRQRAIGGITGAILALAGDKTTRYELHFHWTRNGLEAPNLDKVMAEQAARERARSKAASASFSSGDGDDWQRQQQKAWCAGMGWSSSRTGQFAYDMMCP